MYFSHTALESRESPIRKFHPYAVRAKVAGKKVYHLNIGQPDIETPPAYLDALHHFDEQVLSYAPSPGIPMLIDAIRDYYSGIGVPLNAEDVLVTTGGSEALALVMACILNEGDEIITPEPYYTNYATFALQRGAVIRPIKSSPEEGYHYAEKEKLEQALTDKTRAILLTNPGNPCGTVLTRQEMEMIAEFARKHDLWLIADEVYREFVYTGEALTSFAQLPGLEDRLVLTDSVSKRFSACGARIGCLISKNKELMAHALKFCQARLSVATIDQILATELYRSTTPAYFETVCKEYQKRRDIVMKKLKEIPGVVCECPNGAFYIMAKLPVDDAEKFLVFLLEEFEDHGETVMFAPGRGFYATPGMGLSEVRIAYVLKEDDLARAMDLLALGIKAYNKK